MYSFLVLGLIPGTNIQISFTMWLAATIVLVALMFWSRNNWKHSHAPLPPTIGNDYDYTDTTATAH